MPTCSTMSSVTFDPLLSLPSCLCSSIFSQWLELDDVGKLDSAYCNKDTRVLLLKAFNCDETAFEVVHFACDSFWEWVVLRKIQLSKIVFLYPPDHIIRKKVLDQTGKHLKEIELTDQEDTSCMFADIAHCCPNLDKLVLTYTALNGSLRSIFLACGKLTQVCIDTCYPFKATFLKGVICPNIKTCEIYGDVSDEEFGELVGAFPNLLALSCGGTEVAMRAGIGKDRTKLIALQLYDLENITDESFVAIVAACPSLQVIDFGKCPLLTNVSVSAVALHCKALRVVHAEENINFDDTALITLVDNCLHLETIDIFKCSRITDIGLQYIAKKCTHLKSLNIGGYTINVTAFIEIVKCCPLLSYLWIAETNVTDEELIAIAQHCKYLEKINISSNESLTAEGIFALANHCTNLKIVVISANCTVVNDLVKLMWMKINPKVVISTDDELMCMKFAMNNFRSMRKM